MSRRVHRVLVEELTGSSLVLRGPEAHHLANVLRVKPGADVEAFDGRGLVAPGTVAAVSCDGVELALEEPRASTVEAAIQLTVAVALLKSDKLSDVVRQGTELGVARFELLVTRHADVTTLAPARLQRLRRVAEEAARQSGRAVVPVVTEPIPLEELAWEGTALVADPAAEAPLRSVPREVMSGGAQAGRPVNAATSVGAATGGTSATAATTGAALTSMTIVTGPEGGLAAAEVAALAAKGARPVRLGARILRAETAPVALAAALLLAAEE